ncbi:unnamed protein product [Ixodes hexagonus]
MGMFRQGNCELDINTVLAQLSQSHLLRDSFDEEQADSPDIVEDNILYYVSGYLVRHFLSHQPPDCVCRRFLENDDPQLTASHQFLAMLKSSNFTQEIFANVTVPSDNCFDDVKSLKAHFLQEIGVVAHVQDVNTCPRKQSLGLCVKAGVLH